MKKQIKNFALAIAAVVFTFSAALASNNAPAEKESFKVGLVTLKKGAKVNLLISKPSDGWVSIYLKNEKNEVLYSGVVPRKDKQFAKVFNLEAVEDGQYSFVITDGKNTIEKEVNLRTSEPEKSVTRIASSN